MLKVADEIWLATSLLHLENPSREDFSVSEIIAQARKEKWAGGYRPGLQIHASTHCVATKPPNPARHRMLSETGRGRRRLFRPGDKFHRDRKQGKTHPAVEDLPAKYRYLVDWYKHDYVNGNRDEEPLPPGGKLPHLLKALEGISLSDIKRMEAAIEEGNRWEPIPSGAKITDVLKFKGKISSSDRKLMEAAIKEHCGKINPHAW
jgi:hypothetical protein